MKLSNSDLLSLALICFGAALLAVGAWLYASDEIALGLSILLWGSLAAGYGVGHWLWRRLQ